MKLPLNIDWQQILLHFFNFVVLAGGLYFLLYKPVKDFMDKRKAYYEGMDADAKNKLSEADNLKSMYDQKLANADAEISDKKAGAMAELETIKQQELSAARTEADKIVADARAKANEEHDAIVAKAETDIAALASAATEKLLYKSVSDAYEDYLSAAEGSGVNE